MKANAARLAAAAAKVTIGSDLRIVSHTKCHVRWTKVRQVGDSHL